MVTVVFLVIAVFLYSPYISAAPSTFGSNFESLKQNTTLQRFQSTLLNETYLPFLKTCYEPECCTKGDELLCPVYFELLINVNNANISDDIKSQVDTLRKIKEDEKTIKDFCGTFSSQISTSTLKWTIPFVKKYLSEGCNTTCSDVIVKPADNQMFATIKPVCKFIVWMFNVSAKVMPPGNKLEVKEVQNVTQEHDLHPLVNKAPSKVVTPERKNLTGENELQKVTIRPTTISAKPTKQQSANVQQPIEHPQAPPQEVAVAKQGQASENDINNKITSEVYATSDNTVGNVAENNVNPPELPADFKPKADEIAGKLTNYEEASKPINDMDGNQGMDENPDTSQEDSLQKDDLDDGFNDIPPQAEPSQPARNRMFEDTQKPRISMITKDGSDAYIHDPFHQEEGSNFFTYFLIGMFACIILYVLYHNKTKILALLLEGRRSQKGRGSRRKHTAQYRKLDTNLEEAITSTPSGRSTQIIY